MCSINLPRALKILQVFFIIDSLHVEVLSIVHLQRFLGPLVLQVFDIHRLSVYWTKYKTNEYLSLFWRTTQSWSLQVWILIAYRRVEKQKFTSILQNFSWFARWRMAPKAQVSSTKLIIEEWRNKNSQVSSKTSPDLQGQEWPPKPKCHQLSCFPLCGLCGPSSQ